MQMYKEGSTELYRNYGKIPNMYDFKTMFLRLGVAGAPSLVLE